MVKTNMILVVEDEPNIRHLITVNLRKRGYEVTAVESAEEALECIQKAVPAFMFLDVLLPGMSGLELLAMLDSNPDLPYFCVAVMSAYTLDPVSIPSRRAIGLLRKPLGIDDILSVLEQARVLPNCPPPPQRLIPQTAAT